MLSISSINPQASGSWVPRARRRDERVTVGLVCSVLLHAIVALLLIFGLPVLTQPPPPIEEAIPADLVMQGETVPTSQRQQSVAPSIPAPIDSVKPEPRPVETARPEPPKPAPMAAIDESLVKPQTPPPAPKPVPLKPKPGPKPVARDEPEPSPDRPPAPTQPAEPAFTEFKSGETIEQNAPAPSQAAPNRQAASNRAAPGNAPGAGGTATFDIRDVIRIQIEPRWHPDLELLGSEDWIVAIHVVINPDGTVDHADIVDDPRLVTDQAFRAFAISARNAVTDSSPLHFPPGVAVPRLDLVVKFPASAARR